MEVSYPLLLDGATGTQLQRFGFDGRVSPEEWVLQHPEILADIQKRYVDSGSQIIYAPTFGANRVKLEGRGLFGQTADFNKRLVEISRKAVDGHAFIAGDITSTGKLLFPLGNTDFEELVEIYTEQAKAIEEAGVDLYVIETIISLADARAALLAVKSVSRKPVFVTLTCDKNGRTPMGSDASAALVVLQNMGAEAFGLNCSSGPEEMLMQIRRLHPYAEIPLIAKPNAGMPESLDGVLRYNCPPEEFVKYTSEFAENGVCLFGGCCGTTEAHIAALNDAISNLSPVRPLPKTAGFLTPATEREVFTLPIDAKAGQIIPCNGNLEESLLSANEDKDYFILRLRVKSKEELQQFTDCQHLIDKPLCLVCDNAAILEKALRAYQGRALYEGNLPEHVLLPLKDKYGLIL